MAAGDASAVKHDRNDVSFHHIAGAGHDLHRLLFSYVDLADDELVRVGMLFNGKDLADDDVLEVLVQSLESLNFGAREGHFVAVFLICARKARHIGLDP